jgi:hypothetical protein
VANGVHPLAFLLAVGGTVTAVTRIAGKRRRGFHLEYESGASATCISRRAATPRSCRWGRLGNGGLGTTEHARDPGEQIGVQARDVRGDALLLDCVLNGVPAERGSLEFALH